MRRIGEAIDNVVMMPVGLDHAAGGGAKTGPDIGQQRILAQELGTLATAGPAGDAGTIEGAQQRGTLDSLAFEQDCQMKAVLAPHDSLLKQMRTRFRAQRDSVFTKEQKAKLDLRAKEMQARREAEQAKEPKRQCSGN